MGPQECFLITLSDGAYLLKVALRIKQGTLDPDVIEYYQEPENKKRIHDLLPLHCKSFGNIVDIEALFEIK